MTSYNIEIRPLTIQDYMEFHQSIPEKSLRGYSYVLDGKVVGTVCAVFEKGYWMLCADVKDNLCLPKITIYKWAKKMLNLFSDSKVPIYATSVKSGKFLRKLGFEYCGFKNGHHYYVYAG